MNTKESSDVLLVTTLKRGKDTGSSTKTLKTKLNSLTHFYPQTALFIKTTTIL